MAKAWEKVATAAGLGGSGERRKYPIRVEDYELYEEIGQGVSAIVYRSLCKPLDEIVAVKVLDFERTNSDLNNIMREAQTMILIDQPNVMKAHCSFTNNHSLWVVMPYMAGGSCLHIMKSVYPDGFEEAVIATVLREVLKGLEYLHHHGHIHRDVKAGNILVDSRGVVKLGDFGVSACLFDSGDRQRARNTFVGTPCWMAPEVMEQLHGYDFKADIWSFGITALELAHGHAPFSKFPPMKVLLMTLQNAPPGLDYERDKKFSRHFKQMVAMCLVKDPSKRPTAKKLLKQPFFKQARSSDFISRKLLEGLPGLGARYLALKEKDEVLLSQKKMPDGQKEEISQDEYKRGISSWNFDMDDLKSQASLITECDDSISCKDSDASCFYDLDTILPERATGPHMSRVFSIKYDTDTEYINAQDYKRGTCKWPGQETQLHRNSKHQINIHNRDKCNGGPLQVADEPSPEAVPKVPKSSAANVEDHDDRSKPPLIQQRGRFKVTPGHVELDKAHSPGLQKSHSMQAISHLPSLSIPSSIEAASTIIGGSLYMQLYNVLQTNMLQREQILHAMKQLSGCDMAMTSPACIAPASRASSPSSALSIDRSLLEAAHEKEKELVNEITELQWRLVCSQDEIQRLKAKAAQVLLSIIYIHKKDESSLTIGGHIYDTLVQLELESQPKPQTSPTSTLSYKLYVHTAEASVIGEPTSLLVSPCVVPPAGECYNRYPVD
uniref:Protein kinase domain-containing protein n=1 Tax=Oryza glaberrima TaxID=4538 RepID=I1P520_ORYGL